MKSIQTATVKNIPAIQSIAQRTWPVTFKNILSPDQIAYMLDLMYGTETLVGLIESTQNVFLLALDDKEIPIGFAAYEINHKGSRCTKIHKLYVLPSAQGLGIGNLLCSEIGQRARQASEERIKLNVNKYNHKAISFYEKAGFQTVAEETIPIGQGYLMEDFVMEKPIS